MRKRCNKKNGEGFKWGRKKVTAKNDENKKLLTCDKLN